MKFFAELSCNSCTSTKNCRNICIVNEASVPICAGEGCEEQLQADNLLSSVCLHPSFACRNMTKKKKEVFAPKCIVHFKNIMGFALNRSIYVFMKSFLDIDEFLASFVSTSISPGVFASRCLSVFFQPVYQLACDLIILQIPL